MTTTDITTHRNYRNFGALAGGREPPHDGAMSDMNREEVKARLEASEARIATSLEGMRGDLGSMRHEMVAHQSAMDATLSKILLFIEKDRSDRYAAGYKIITWTIGTVVALAGLGMAFYRTFAMHL